MRTADVKLNFHPNHFYPENGRSIFIWTIGVHSITTMNASLSGRAIPQPSLYLHGKLQDKLYLYLYQCSLSCRPLYCMQRLHLCCSWLHIPACCPSICNLCAMLYVEPPPWGVWTRSAFWRGHRETQKFFKVLCGHYYEEIWYDMIWYDMIWYDMIWYDMIYFVNCSSVGTPCQYYSTHLHTSSAQHNTM